MARTARQILNGLSHQRTIHIRSTAELAAHVDSAAAAIDKQRREKGQEAVRRKPELHPVARVDCERSIELTPWQVLHALARGFVLPSQGMGRGLAEHWLSLKYCEALHGNRAGSMDLTEKGRSSERWYKSMQARELAVGFGLAAAEHIVQQHYPDHIVSVVDTSTVLRAGWALGGSQRGKGSRPRPDYLIEAWKPGEPSKVTFVVCRGNHQKPSKRTGRTRSTTLQQLVKGSELTEGMQIGPWNTTPCLMLSTELMGQGGVVVNALQSPGEALLPLRTPDGPGNADEEIRDKPGIPYPNAIRIPARDGKRTRTVDGFQVPERPRLVRPAPGPHRGSRPDRILGRRTDNSPLPHRTPRTKALRRAHLRRHIQLPRRGHRDRRYEIRRHRPRLPRGDRTHRGVLRHGFETIRTHQERPRGRVPESSLRTPLDTARNPRSRAEMERPDLVPRRRSRHGPEHPAHPQTAPALNQGFGGLPGSGSPFLAAQHSVGSPVGRTGDPAHHGWSTATTCPHVERPHSEPSPQLHTTAVCIHDEVRQGTRATDPGPI
ncbi:hypothetical protein ACWD0J_12030 [Streptomyces sp. NPDC003011]